jgi:hypothetical protein
MKIQGSSQFRSASALAIAASLFLFGFWGTEAARACSPPPTYTLTTQVTGQGTVTPSSGVYSSGTVVNISATASSGWEFDHWEVDLTGETNPTTITMNANKTVRAVFVQEYYTLSLAVNDANAGSATPSPAPDPEGYLSGTVVTVTAVANPGYVFDHWEGDLTTSNNPDTITMNADKVVTAIFLPEYTLTTSVQGSGSVTPAPPGGTYAQGTQVTLTAVANTGWDFDHWEGAASGTNPVTVVTMDANKSVTAVFVETYYTLTLAVNDPAAGSITPTPAPGPQGYQAGTMVALAASANPGFAFSHWTGDLGTLANPENILMNANKAVTAVFVPEYTLTATVQGSGTVELSPPGGVYPDGQSVTVTASPTAGWVFDHWEGAVTGATNPGEVLMDANKTVTAVFLERFTLAVTTEGQGTVDPSGGVYSAGTQVSLTATPSGQDMYFIEWQGDLTGSDNPASLTMDADKDITAVFAKKFQVNNYAVGNGTVTPPSDLFLEGTEVEFTATPAANWAFDRWSGDLPGGVNRYIEATATQIERAMNVYAHFIERPGLSDLDMVGDLNYFLQAVGESATAATFDRNGIDYDSSLNRIYVGNGILDAAELYLLETVLKTRNLDLTYKSAVAHNPVWAAWQTNLAQAQSDLSGYDARIARVVAGYMTIGDFDTVESIRSLVEQALTSVTIDPADYDLWPQRYLYFKRDADNDGFTNLLEWQIASPTASLDNLEAFSAAALDGEPPEGETQPLIQPTGCDNETCLDRGHLYVDVAQLGYVPDDCQAWGTPDGDGIALGTEFRVFANPDRDNAWGFGVWLAGTGQSMIDGSRDLVDSDMLQGNLYALGVFVRTGLLIPDDGQTSFSIEAECHNGAKEMTIDGKRMVFGPPGSFVTLTATSNNPTYIVVDWEVKGGIGYANPRYSREKSVTVWLTEYARPRLGTQIPDTKRIELPVGQGGMVLASQSTGWGGFFLHALAIDKPALVDLNAVPSPGWEFVEWQIASDPPITSTDPSITGLSGNALSSATAVFRPLPECRLDVEVEDASGGNPVCAGYVTVDEAKRYYVPSDDSVELTAIPEPGYVFLGWEGDFLVPTLQNPLELDVAEFGIDRQVKATFLYDPLYVNQGTRRILETTGDTDQDGFPDNTVMIYAAPAIADVRARIQNMRADSTVRWRATLDYDVAGGCAGRWTEATGILHFPGTPEPTSWVELPGTQPFNLTDYWDHDDLFRAGDLTIEYEYCTIAGDFACEIRGENPEDTTARAYIDAQAQAGGRDHWYAYAIAKHETRQGNEIYNQFDPPTPSVPIVGDPCGYGMFQNDPPDNFLQTWNWNANVVEGMERLDGYRTEAANWLQEQNNQATAASGPPLSSQQFEFGGLIFQEGTDRSATDACTIQRYNGVPNGWCIYWNGDSQSGVWADREEAYIPNVCAELEE